MAKMCIRDRGYKERLYARVLSTPEVVKTCAELGFEGKHLICMQGPFSEELNVAMMRQIDAAYLVTKESGKAGGFEEKIRAAKKAGAKAVVIGRPSVEKGMSLEAVSYTHLVSCAYLAVTHASVSIPFFSRIAVTFLQIFPPFLEKADVYKRQIQSDVGR